MIPTRRVRPIASLREVLQDRLAKLSGRPSSGMLSNHEVGGKPLIFLHNPKTGGNSLRPLLGVKRLSHSYASKRLSEQTWLNTFSVVVVRNPFERFLSGYFSHIVRPDMNGLVKTYGPGIKDITPLEYLEVLKANPKYGGPQTLWTDYPSAQKPRADLVLRVEESDQWTAQLKAAGVDLGEASVPHANKSARGQSDQRAQLGLSEQEFDALKSAVQSAYAADYETFGYSTK